jgi:hypothetical protein
MKGGWRNFHNEELHSLQSSINIIRIIKNQITEDGLRGACRSTDKGKEIPVLN